MTVHQWYRTDDTYARDIASAQKSVLSLLVGRAIADGFIGIDTLVDDVLGSGWTPHGQTSGITVRHLLTMTSGLDDGLALCRRRAPAGCTAVPSRSCSRSSRSPPAAMSTTSPTSGCSNRREPTRAVFYERRTDEVAPIGMRATVKDLAAIGQVVLDGSQPGLPDRWLDESFTPSQPFNRRTDISGG